MHVAHGGKNTHRLQRQAARGFFYLMGQHVKQDFGVALGVDVAMVGDEQLAFERLCIGQITVVNQHNAKRRIHVKRLRFFFTVSIPRRRVAHLAQSAVARQRAHVAGAKNILHQALGFVHEELALLLRDDARRILPPMLQ